MVRDVERDTAMNTGRVGSGACFQPPLEHPLAHPGEAQALGAPAWLPCPLPRGMLTVRSPWACGYPNGRQSVRRKPAGTTTRQLGKVAERRRRLPVEQVHHDAGSSPALPIAALPGRGEHGVAVRAIRQRARPRMEEAWG